MGREAREAPAGKIHRAPTRDSGDMTQVPLAIPDPVRAPHRGWQTVLAYAYGPETPTWRLDGPSGERRFLKVAPIRRDPGLAAERVRMEWAAGRLPVPAVLDSGTDGKIEWLLTAALPGVDATAPELLSAPISVVPILARGLRAIHETPANDCPFVFRIPTALARARRRVAAGLVDPADDLHPEHRHLTPKQAVEVLEATRPGTEDLVLCHGDYCFPNVLIEGDRVVGYVDLGEMGLADRWWDLAVATWSVTWNAGPGWERLFLESYGIAPDDARIAFYRLLYDLIA